MAYCHETEFCERYAAELDKAADILQRVHPIGQVRGIGRLEVVTALEQIHPADDREPVTVEWLKEMGFEESEYGDGWFLTDNGYHVAVWLKPGGETWHADFGPFTAPDPWPWDIYDRGQVRGICRALQLMP